MGAQIEARVRGITTGTVDNLFPDFIKRRAFYQKSGGALLEGARGLGRIKNRGEHKYASATCECFDRLDETYSVASAEVNIQKNCLRGRLS
jgi:hypothetical protein